jgi:hypothetical protein
MWARAIKRYEEITDKPLVDASLSGISTVQGLTELIDNENDAFTNFRAKRQALFGAFSSALLPLEIVMGETANGVFPPSAIVFSAVVHLVSSAKGVSDKYDAIIELMTALKDFTVRLETYTRQVISTQLTDKLGAIVVALIEVLAISREAIRHGRVRSFGRSLAGGNQDAKQAMDKLIRLVDSERGLAVAETLTETKSIASYVSNINTKVSALYDKVEAISMSRDAALGDVHDTKSRSAVDKLKNILQPIMASEDVYWAIQRNRVAGTGTWVWEEPLFKSWLRGERLVLWISGNPGAGKSYIASNIINFLQEQYPQKVNHVSHVSVVYFYFKEDDSKTRSFPQALRDMAFMAAENDQVYAKFLANRLESADGLRSTSGAWKKLIFDFFVQGNRDSQLVMLLDGMDESFQADREEFFDLARDVCENGNIRLVMLGRPQIVEEIIRIMDVPTIPTIGVTPKTNFADIVRYINTTISKSSSLRRVSKAKRKELAAMISDKAGGMVGVSHHRA